MSTPANDRRFPGKQASFAISEELRAFRIDRAARGLSPRTLAWYADKLSPLEAYLTAQGVTDVLAVEPTHLRAYLLWLAERGHNPGGVRGHFQAMRTFFRWFGAEHEPPNWRNPIRRVTAPRVPDTPLEPVPIEDLRAMLTTCQRRTFTGDRDRALFLFLLDTGCRRGEVAALDVGDVDLNTGSVLVRHGKGGKVRTVFLGSSARRAMLRYLRHRGDLADNAPLWAAQDGHRLAYDSYDGILRRRAARAGVAPPSMHSFRRAFALNALRNGVDLVSLQRLLGHADLSVLRRYLAQSEGDLAAAHRKASPVDRLKLKGRG